MTLSLRKRNGKSIVECEKHIIISKPIVSSKIYKMLFSVIKIWSGLKELSVIREGNRKAGRSVYKEQSGSAEKF